SVAQPRQRIQGGLAEHFGGIPGGLIEKVGDGLACAIAAGDVAETLQALAAVETGDGTDDTPEMGEVATADQLTGLPEKALAERGELSDPGHRVFPPCAGRKAGRFFHFHGRRDPSFWQPHATPAGELYSLSCKAGVFAARRRDQAVTRGRLELPRPRWGRGSQPRVSAASTTWSCSSGFRSCT